MTKIIGERPSEDILSKSYDCLIIGSGISGLCCGAMLSKMGKKVLILEKHYMVGGLTHTFSRKGYEWDVGLHYVGEMNDENHPFKMLFDYITDGELKWDYMGAEYDRIIFPDQSYSFIAGRDNFISELSKTFSSSEDIKSLNEYLKLVKKVAESGGFYFLGKSYPKLSFLDKTFAHYSKLTTYQVLKTLTNNEKLIGVLTGQYGDYALPPKKSSFAIHAIVALHYINGGNYPIGGSSEIAKGIVKVINKNGGKVVFNAGVEKILVKDGVALGVKLDSGREIYANHIISSVGAHLTYNQLLNPEEVGSDFFTRVKNAPYSTSALGIYIGLKEKSESVIESKSNLWIYPSYDHDKNVSDYLADQSKPLPLVYISFPLIKDPTFETRYPGRSTIAMLGAAPYDWFSKWENTEWRRRGAEYEDYKETLAQRYLDVLYQHMPNAKNKIDYYEVSTPLSNKRFTYYAKGEVYGLEASPKRFEETGIGMITPIKNLLLTGQDSTMAGICGSLIAGAMTAFALHPVKTSAAMFNLKLSRLFK